MRRSSNRVKEIDAYLREFYPKHGPNHCAIALDEPEEYISKRAKNIGCVLSADLKGHRGRPSRKEHIKIQELSGKLEAKNEEIIQLKELILKERELKNRLRTENIELIHKNVLLLRRVAGQ